MNWVINKALMVGEGLKSGLKRPGGLKWKASGLKYLCIFRDQTQKNVLRRKNPHD